MMRNKPLQRIIGITGGSGVGKGEVCRILVGLGAEIINTDSLAHRIILRGESSAYEEILAEFGSNILGDNGEIDRKKLGAIVFADKSGLAALSRIVHKYVRAQCEEIISLSTGDVIAIDAPALIEAAMEDICDDIVGIFARRNLRIKRIMARDGISREAAEKRIGSQMPDAVLRGHVDIAIDNNGTLEELEEKLSEHLL
jgi:dephospho-CoA kinase